MSAYIGFVVLFGVAYCVTLVPNTPCKDIFNYYESETNEVYGSIKLDDDLSGNYHLEVNMSISLETSENIRISRAVTDEKNKNEETLEFYVDFPYNHSIPKLTSITWNGKAVCTGPPENGSTVTLLSKSYLFSTEISPSVRPQTSNALIVDTQINNNVTKNNIKYYNCGVDNLFESHVFSGRSTKASEYPWLAAMFYLKEGKYEYKCGASIISNKHVITAAHCMQRKHCDNINKEDIILVMGKLNFKNWGSRSMLRGIKEYIIHPEFERRDRGGADLAVIVLDNSVTFGKMIKPIDLWDESIELPNILGLNGSVAAWGRDENQREYANQREQIAVPATYEKCLWSDDRYEDLMNRTFCTSPHNEFLSVDDTFLSCTGNGGSGFILQHNGRWYLRGVGSIALGDFEPPRICDMSQYTVFSDVAKFDNWIRRVMQLS